MLLAIGHQLPFRHTQYHFFKKIPISVWFLLLLLLLFCCYCSWNPDLLYFPLGFIVEEGTRSLVVVCHSDRNWRTSFESRKIVMQRFPLKHRKIFNWRVHIYKIHTNCVKTNSNHSGLKQLLFIIYLNFEGVDFHGCRKKKTLHENVQIGDSCHWVLRKKDLLKTQYMVISIDFGWIPYMFSYDILAFIATYGDILVISFFPWNKVCFSHWALSSLGLISIKLKFLSYLYPSGPEVDANSKISEYAPNCGQLRSLGLLIRDLGLDWIKPKIESPLQQKNKIEGDPTVWCILHTYI